MKTKNNLFHVTVLCLVLLIILSCNLIGNPQAEQPGPSAVETDIALQVLATRLANQQLTLEALQAQLTPQAPSLTPTQTSEPLPSPTQTIQPTAKATDTAGIPLDLVLDVQTSVDTFYCYDSPFELTITVKVSDIDRGLAVYYHIQDKKSGVSSEGQVIDLHRKTSDTRSATIIGGGSAEQNLQFPPLMGESYFIYQLISDDGSYRSPVYSNVTFFPCAQ
jgi:hypothetical protein